MKRILILMPVLVMIMWSAAGLAVAYDIDVTSGTIGIIFLNQSFNETRGVDVTVLTSYDLLVTAMTLTDLKTWGEPRTLRARIYDSSTQDLIASADMTFSSDGVATIPISANLSSGASYRLAFYGILNSEDVFAPAGFPYTDSTGSLRINQAYESISDSFPTNVNEFDPLMVVSVVPSTTVSFSTLGSKLRINAGPPLSFDLNASFTLGANSNGINPLAEDVTLQVGTYSVTIPAGSFQQLKNGAKNGAYVFSGVIGGVTLSLQIASPSVTGDGWSFKASGTPVDLTGLSNPVTVMISIGNDSGTTTVNAIF